MRVQGFHHLAIQVRDLERTAAFYREVLGFPEQVRHRRPDGSVRSIWLALPTEGFLALEQVSGPTPAAPFSHESPGLHVLAFRVSRDSRTALLSELAGRGIPVVKQSRWTVYVQDPEGNRIGLSHHPEDPLSEAAEVADAGPQG
jgi:catechol 2,3-dioxygenase-like lactoylglutathione lyase family enzyme